MTGRDSSIPPDVGRPIWHRFKWRLFALSIVMLAIFFANDMTITNWPAMAYPFLIVVVGLFPLARAIWRIEPFGNSMVLNTLAILIPVVVVVVAFFTNKLLVAYQATVAISLPFGIGFACLSAITAWREHSSNVRIYSSSTHSFEVLLLHDL